MLLFSVIFPGDHGLSGELSSVARCNGDLKLGSKGNIMINEVMTNCQNVGDIFHYHFDFQQLPQFLLMGSLLQDHFSGKQGQWKFISWFVYPENKIKMKIPSHTIQADQNQLIGALLHNFKTYHEDFHCFKLSIQLIHITLPKENFDAAWWTTTAFSYKRSIIGSHVCNNLVYHFDLQQQIMTRLTKHSSAQVGSQGGYYTYIFFSMAPFSYFLKRQRLNWLFTAEKWERSIIIIIKKKKTCF